MSEHPTFRISDGDTLPQIDLDKLHDGLRYGIRDRIEQHDGITHTYAVPSSVLLQILASWEHRSELPPNHYVFVETVKKDPRNDTVVSRCSFTCNNLETTVEEYRPTDPDGHDYDCIVVSEVVVLPHSVYMLGVKRHTEELHVFEWVASEHPTI